MFIFAPQMIFAPRTKQTYHAFEWDTVLKSDLEEMISSRDSRSHSQDDLTSPPKKFYTSTTKLQLCIYNPEKVEMRVVGSPLKTSTGGLIDLARDSAFLMQVRN